MEPAWSLVKTRSQFSVVGFSRARPAVRTLLLWQDRQYFCINSGVVWALATAIQMAASAVVLRIAALAGPSISTGFGFIQPVKTQGIVPLLYRAVPRQLSITLREHLTRSMLRHH